MPIAPRYVRWHAVIEVESHITDPTALFRDPTDADDFAKKLNDDPDWDGQYVVQMIDLDANTIHVGK